MVGDSDEDPAISFAKTRNKLVRVVKLMDIPAGRIAWATPTATEQGDTLLLMREDDGGAHPARGRDAETANEGFVSMWVYAPNDDEEAGMVTRN